MPITCNNRGWVLMYTLIFCVFIEAVALVGGGFVLQNLKSGSAFRTLLSGRHISADENPVLKSTIYGAPEGWDHASFLTEVMERRWKGESAYSWRVRLREQPVVTLKERSLSGWRPYVILLVDDSRGMLASCGYLYRDSQIYFQQGTEEIVPSRERDDITSTLTTAGGTYFRGASGNASKQAVDLYHFGGTMQCWTFSTAYLRDLVEDLDLCPMAVATVSRGIVQPFTHDRKAILSAIEGIRPQSDTSRISETCLGLTGLFPNSCSTSKHIVIASTGIALKDGNLPSEVRDFDKDGNPLDTIMDEGSHCLDDVAAYARSKGILVHTVGPDTSFLKGVAAKGGGAYLPTKGTFTPPASFLCQAPSLYGTVRRLPVNSDLAFGPAWLVTTDTVYHRLMSNSPPHLASSTKFSPRGAAPSLYATGPRLFCTTSRDDLLCIDMPTGSCTWMVHGAGGCVKVQDEVVVAGPNLDGDIIGLSGLPMVGWTSRGDLFALSPGTAYVANGSNITALNIDSGAFEAGYDLGSPVRVLEYDPGRQVVLAGTQTGLVYILGRDLRVQELLNPAVNAQLYMLRSFHLKKDLYVIAVAGDQVVCMTAGSILWRSSLGGALCTGAVVMDGKLYAAAWTPGECGGIDSGSSVLQVMDVKTGQAVSSYPLFDACAFGPLVDLDAGILEYTSWRSDSSRIDIQALTGMRPCPLGSRLN